VAFVCSVPSDAAQLPATGTRFKPVVGEVGNSLHLQQVQALGTAPGSTGPYIRSARFKVDTDSKVTPVLEDLRTDLNSDAGK
jgi:hypothetical protein